MIKITLGLKKREKPIKEFEELHQAGVELKKAILEAYIKSPMGRLSIWLLDKIEKFLKRR